MELWGGVGWCSGKVWHLSVGEHPCTTNALPRPEDGAPAAPHQSAGPTPASSRRGTALSPGAVD